MLLRSMSFFVLTVCVAASVWAGSVARASAHSIRMPLPTAGAEPLTLYAANERKNRVDLFGITGLTLQPMGSITAGVSAPRDVFIAANGTIYVANQKSVTEYPKGQVTPSVTLPLPVSASALSVGRDGTVFVCGQQAVTNGSIVVEFDPGALHPSREIHYPDQDPDFLSCGGLGADASGNLYVNVGSGSANGGFAIYMYPPKQIKSTRTLSTNGPNAFGAISFVRNSLIVGDPADYELFALQLPSGKETVAFPTEGGGDYVSLDGRNGHLFTVAQVGGTLQIYDLATGKLLTVFRRFSRGIAIDPPAQ